MTIARQFLYSTVTSFALVSGAWAQGAPAPEGMVVLTVSGETTEANRAAALEDGRDMMSKYGIAFDKAVEFDLAGLASLEQGEVERTIYVGEFEGTFSGPKLAAVLDAAGFPLSTVWAMALDGYSAEIPGEFIEEYDPILATHLDGKPLGIGRYGPTTVVFPETDDAEVNEQTDAMLPWATFYIEVE
ncbi:MAG: hypothetical protein AAGF74_18530 [Pseudomonadota bacterium]